MRSALDKSGSHVYVWLQATLGQEVQRVLILRYQKKLCLSCYSNPITSVPTVEIMRHLIWSETGGGRLGLVLK